MFDVDTMMAQLQVHVGKSLHSSAMDKMLRAAQAAYEPPASDDEPNDPPVVPFAATEASNPLRPTQVAAL